MRFSLSICKVFHMATKEKKRGEQGKRSQHVFQERLFKEASGVLVAVFLG